MRASPPDIASLAGKRVALWGWGREGRAAHLAIRARLPQLVLALFCSESEAVDAAGLNDPLLAFEREATGEALSAFDVVVKSPGISPYTPEARSAAERGTRFVGGTGLWFAERANDGTMANTFCVTGTKGKSTTTALLAHLLRAAGLRTALAGNIGLPLLELVDETAQAWAIELSSYQTRDVAASGARPRIAIATNIHPEHLDWHGSERRYVDDKLALLTEAKPEVAAELQARAQAQLEKARGQFVMLGVRRLRLDRDRAAAQLLEQAREAGLGLRRLVAAFLAQALRAQPADAVAGEGIGHQAAFAQFDQ